MEVQAETELQNGFTLNVPLNKLAVRAGRMEQRRKQCCTEFMHFVPMKITTDADGNKISYKDSHNRHVFGDARIIPNACCLPHCTKQMCRDKRTRENWARLAPYYLPLIALRRQRTVNVITFTTGKNRPTLDAATIKSYNRSISRVMRRFSGLDWVGIPEPKPQRNGMFHFHYHIVILSWNSPDVREFKAAWNKECSKRHADDHANSNGHFSVNAGRKSTHHAWLYQALRQAEFGLGVDHKTNEVYFSASDELYVTMSHGVKKTLSHRVKRERTAAELRQLHVVYQNLKARFKDVMDGKLDAPQRDYLKRCEDFYIFRLLKAYFQREEWELIPVGSTRALKPDGLPPDGDFLQQLIDDSFRLAADFMDAVNNDQKEFWVTPTTPTRGPDAVYAQVKAGIVDISGIQKGVMLAGMSPAEILDSLQYCKAQGRIMETSPGRYCVV